MMKFGKLIECNMRNIFLKKSYIKCVGGTIPRLFSRNPILQFWAYHWINSLTGWFYGTPLGTLLFSLLNISTILSFKERGLSV